MKNYSSNIRLISLLGWALCLFWTSTGAAQEAPAARLDSTEREKVDIDNADVWQVLQGTGDEITQRLIGNVELSQDSIYMYADSADLVNSVQLYAYDNVIIQQGDSIAAFSDRLDYNAEDKIAHLRRNVILQNGDRELYTDALTYDLATKLATYTTGGRLTDGDTELRSTYGYYYGDTDQIYFRDSVVVVGEEFEMRADTLRYDATNETVHFLGPTVIRTDTAEIYCEAGYYKVEDEIAVFRNNAQYRSGEQIATADSITYRGDLGTYFLDGNAYVREGDERLARAKRIRIKREEEIYELQGNGLFIDSTRTVRGDTIKVDQSQNTYSVSGGQPEVIDGTMILSAKDIDFDEASGIGRARGNVIWRDTSANLEIQAERADYNEATGYLKASGGRGDRPLLITLLEGDSLFVTA
ncbi:MAG: OstA-like protein, partial [Bacteroidota bacterium]